MRPQVKSKDCTNSSARAHREQTPNALFIGAGSLNDELLLQKYKKYFILKPPLRKY